MSNPQPTNWIRPPYAKEESASAQMRKRKQALDAAEERARKQPGDIFEYFDEMYKEVV
tara:strand:+ start:190 stop:363 length:174 start_codon:yes stop_codon:yes gene_type:complete